MAFSPSPASAQLPFKRLDASPGRNRRVPRAAGAHRLSERPRRVADRPHLRARLPHRARARGSARRGRRLPQHSPLLLSAAATADPRHARRGGVGLLDRRRILDAAEAPELVEPARDAELASPRRDCARRPRRNCRRGGRCRRPIVGQPHRAAEIALRAEQAPDRRACSRPAPCRGSPGRRRAPRRRQHGEMHPLHQSAPFRIVLAHRRAERLLRDDVGQDDVLGRHRAASGARRRAARRRW